MRIIFGILLGVYLVLRLVGLSTDLTNSDAIRWHKRSEDFIQAIQKGNFAETYQKYHPGVTLMWINGTTKFLAQKTGIIKMGDRVTYENVDWYPKVDLISKTSLVSVLFALLLVQLFFISKITNIKTSIIYLFFMTFEPYLVGIDRWFHLTSLETYLVFTSFLVFSYAGISKKYKLITFSALLFGFAILTKISALIALPIFAFLFWKLFGLKNFKFAGLFLMIFLLTFYVFFPAIWVEPVQTLSKIFGGGSDAVDGSLRTENSAQSYLFYVVIVFLKIGFTSLLFFVLAKINFIKKIFNPNIFNLSLFFYVLIYFVFLAFSGQKIDRYVVLIIPAMLLIISNYLSELSKNKIIAALTIHLLTSIIYLYLFFPVMSSFINLGLWNFALKNGYYDNSGEYYAQAAIYAEKSKVYIPNNIDSFTYYFHGNLVGINDKPNYIIDSYDFDRRVLNYDNCKEFKRFGNLIYQPVVVFQCL